VDAEGYRTAIELYTRAIAEYPDYAPPYSGLADVYTAMSSWSMDRPSSLMPLAKRAALEALRLDPALAHAYSSLAWVTFGYDWNWGEGLALAQKALALEPNYAFGYITLGGAYLILGRIVEAREQFERSLQLDPLAIRAHRLLGFALTLEGRFEESAQRLMAARRLAPDSHELAFMMARVFLVQGRLEDAIRYAQEAQRNPISARMLGILGEALVRSDRNDEAQEILRQIEAISTREYVDPWTLCRVHMVLNEPSRSMDYLEKGLQDRSTLALYATIDPIFEPSRKDRRFREILAQLHLPSHRRSFTAKS
jgi:serine/threonine-protein kinase